LEPNMTTVKKHGSLPVYFLYASSAGMQQEKIFVFFFKLEKKMYILQKEMYM
jgi:hypothetical protein